MARFKNISGDDRRVGRPDGPLVAAGDIVTIDADVLAELDDAWVTGGPDDVVLDEETKERIGFTGDARAWPKETWELIREAAPAPAARRASTEPAKGE